MCGRWRVGVIREWSGHADDHIEVCITENADVHPLQRPCSLDTCADSPAIVRVGPDVVNG
jgi:hypothetical protein